MPEPAEEELFEDAPEDGEPEAPPEPRRRKPRQPGTVSVDQKERVRELLDENERGEAHHTLDQIAELAGVGKGTVNRINQEVEAARNLKKAAATGAVVPEPIEVFRNLMRTTPGIPREKAAWAIQVVESNPRILGTPTDLERLLAEGMGLKPYFRQLVVKAVMDVQQPQPSIAYLGPTPNQQGWSSWAPGQPAMPQGGAPPWATPQTQQWAAWGPPPWWQPQKPDALTREDVLEIVTKALERQAPSHPQPDPEYEEVQEPVLRGDGKPLLDDDGQPVMRFIRRRAREAAPIDPLDQIIRLKQAGILGGENTEVRLLQQELQHLTGRLNERRTDDPEQRAVLDEMRRQAGEVKERLAAESARREAEDKYRAELQRLQTSSHERDLQVAAARAGLPADAQILTRGIDGLEKTVDRAMANQDRRMARLEQLAMQVLKPADAGPTVPLSQGELDTFLAAQQRIDAKEATTTPPLPPTTLPPTPPTTAEALKDEEAYASPEANQ